MCKLDGIKKRRSLLKLYQKVTSSILARKRQNNNSKKKKKKKERQETGITGDLHHSFETKFPLDHSIIQLTMNSWVRLSYMVEH